MIAKEFTRLGKDFPVPEYLKYTDEGKKTEIGQLNNPGWSFMHNYNCAHNVGMVTVRFPKLMNRHVAPVKTAPFKEKLENAENTLNSTLHKLSEKLDYGIIVMLADIVLTGEYDSFFALQFELKNSRKLSEVELSDLDNLFYTMGVFKRKMQLTA